MNHKPIKSVIELARYPVGSVAYWVTLRSKQNEVKIPPGEEWTLDYHPKVLHERGYNKIWNKRISLPKLHHADFHAITNLLTSNFEVESFKIHDIIRSNDTGEFFYCNETDEWLPEKYLLDTIIAARKERDRIKKLIRKWAE